MPPPRTVNVVIGEPGVNTNGAETVVVAVARVLGLRGFLGLRAGGDSSAGCGCSDGGPVMTGLAAPSEGSLGSGLGPRNMTPPPAARKSWTAFCGRRGRAGRLASGR